MIAPVATTTIDNIPTATYLYLPSDFLICLHAFLFRNVSLLLDSPKKSSDGRETGKHSAGDIEVDVASVR